MLGYVGAGCHPTQATVGSEARVSPQTEPMARMASGLIRTGIRTSMLAGDGLTVRDFIRNARRTHPGLRIRLYSHEGEVIYAEKQQPPPEASSLPRLVNEALAAREPFTNASGELVTPIAGGPQCVSCHGEGPTRGVLLTTLAPNAAPSDEALSAGLAEIIAHAFERMMTVGAQEHLATYFEALTETVPGVANSAVFSLDGEPTIGDGFMEAPAGVLERALRPGPPFIQATDDGIYAATPLLNKSSCNNCHEKGRDKEMRGAIITQFDPSELNVYESARTLTTESLRHVMMTGLGRILHRLLREIREGSLTQELRVYDPDGRLFHDSRREVQAPEHIARMLAGGTAPLPTREGDGMVFVQAIENEAACQRCHAGDHPVRAVLEVAVPVVFD